MEYKAPTSVDEAVSLLAGAGGGASVLAGGTDLLVQMKAGRRSPDMIVDIKNIAELKEISVDASGVRIGAAVAGAELSEHPEVKNLLPGVVEAVDLIGSTQIQGRATAAGNLCNASPAADSVPAMIAAGGIATVAGPNGTREVPVEDIPTGPGKTSLGVGEFIVSIFFPAQSGQGDAYLRMIPRTEMDIAIAGVGVCLTLGADGTCTSARVAVGAVAPTALLVADAGAALVGSKGDDAALEKMSAAVRAACKPIDDKRGTAEYRTKVAGVLAQRSAKIAFERAGS